MSGWLYRQKAAMPKITVSFLDYHSIRFYNWILCPPTKSAFENIIFSWLSLIRFVQLLFTFEKRLFVPLGPRARVPFLSFFRRTAATVYWLRSVCVCKDVVCKDVSTNRILGRRWIPLKLSAFTVYFTIVIRDQLITETFTGPSTLGTASSIMNNVRNWRN